LRIPINKLVCYLIVLLTLFASASCLANNSSSALSMKTYKSLSQVEGLLYKEEFSNAQAQLDKLLRDISKLSLADKAYTYHMQALIHLNQQHYASARKYFLQSYQTQDDGQPGLNNKTRLEVVLMLANLALQDEDYQQAIKFSQEYLQMTQQPSKSGYLILASAYYQTADYEKAIKPLKQLINLFEADRSVYSTLFAVYYQLKQLPEATLIVEKMIRYWPEKAEYWLQLASIYLEQDKVMKSLEVMQLSLIQGFIIRQNDFMQYVYALYDKNLPNKAATILSAAMDQSIVKANHKNYALLAALYVEAKEEDKALLSYKKAAKLAADGKEDLLIAQIYYDQENYQQSIKYARTALVKDIKKRGYVHMLIAACYHELDDIAAAREQLNKAANYKETKITARQWLLSIGDS
jgi:tetratricopeptide (TPR) repeat protein